jgi:hypothetical protein
MQRWRWVCQVLRCVPCRYRNDHTAFAKLFDDRLPKKQASLLACTSCTHGTSVENHLVPLTKISEVTIPKISCPNALLDITQRPAVDSLESPSLIHSEWGGTIIPTVTVHEAYYGDPYYGIYPIVWYAYYSITLYYGMILYYGYVLYYHAILYYHVMLYYVIVLYYHIILYYGISLYYTILHCITVENAQFGLVQSRV